MADASVWGRRARPSTRVWSALTRSSSGGSCSRLSCSAGASTAESPRWAVRGAASGPYAWGCPTPCAGWEAASKRATWHRDGAVCQSVRSDLETGMRWCLGVIVMLYASTCGRAGWSDTRASVCFARLCSPVSRNRGCQWYRQALGHGVIGCTTPHGRWQTSPANSPVPEAHVCTAWVLRRAPVRGGRHACGAPAADQLQGV